MLTLRGRVLSKNFLGMFDRVSGRSWIVASIFLLVEICAVGVGQLFRVEHVAIFWPANGIALGALLARPRRDWLMLTGAFALAYLIGGRLFADAHAVRLGTFLVANLLELVPAAWIIRHIMDRTGGMIRVGPVVALVLVGAGVGPAIGATVAAGGLAAFDLGQFPVTTWMNWQLGNAASTALVALPAYALCAPDGEFRRAHPGAEASRVQVLESGAIAAAGLGLVYLLFWTGVTWPPQSAPSYLLFPVMVWAALRCSMRILVAMVPVIGVAAASGTAFGPAGTVPASAGLAAPDVTDVHGYLVVLALTAYTTAVLRETRAAAMRAVEASNQRLAEAEQAATRRAEMLLNATGEGIYGLDTHGRTTFANPAAERMLGHAGPDMRGRNQHALIHHTRPDGTPYPEAQCPIYATLRHGHATEAADEVFWRKDGASFPVAYRSNPIRDETGALAGAVVVFRDISDVKATQAQLRASEARFRSIFDHAPLGIVLLGPGGEIRHANRAAQVMGGHDPDALVGTHFTELTSAEDVHTARANFMAALAGERGPHRHEARHLRADGGLVWGRVHLARLSESDGDGEPLVLALVEDVTERKRIETALKQEKAFSDDIISRSPHPIVSLAPGGTLRFMNNAAEHATGYSAHDLRGADWWATMFPGQDYDQVTRLFARLNAQGDVGEYPVTVTRAAGSRRVLALTTHSRLDRDGNVGEMIVYGRDVTAEHEHQARQQQQDKLRALGEMAGGMAHEINNALQPLVGMLGMLGERVGQYDAKLAAQVEMLENHALHARNIVGDVLAFARSGGPQTESVPVTDVLAEVTDFVDRLLPSRVRVERRGFPPDTPAVPPDTRVDVSRNGMIQVLQNLMTNAADAMDGRGTMVVSLHQADGQDTSDTVTIAVTDHGPGMDEVTRRDVFNPFYSTKPVGEGTGLGLSVVYGIVTNWGGGVDIESTLGKGTTVRIHLPIVIADDPEHADA